jgi:glyoxylase-like metal-dependent hydrolase (beta-lactamase superfamily II)
MTTVKTQQTALRWDVIMAPGIPMITSDLLPGIPQRMFSPTSATLISGKQDAVLVDTRLPIEQTHLLGAWVEAPGKNLTTIYLTHGHGNHFFM